MENLPVEKPTLLFALLAGIAFGGSWCVLFSASVAFSIFPLLALALTIYCLLQRYQRYAMMDGMASLALGCFGLGLFGYAALVRTQYPQMGSNFLFVVISLALIFWLGVRLQKLRQTTVTRTESATQEEG